MPRTPLPTETRRRIRRRLIQATAGAAGYALVIFLAAGTWRCVWGWVLMGVMAALFVARTALEDRTLAAELPGYVAYRAETRYELLPGVW